MNTQFNEARQLARRRKKELEAFMQSSKAVLAVQKFSDSARSIFNYCKDLIGATSGYVALLSADGTENELLFLESGGMPCSVDPHLPMPIRGLREEAYRSHLAVYNNDFMKSPWAGLMPEGHVVLSNVLFAPLVISDKTVGIIGLANKASDFDDNDAKMATGFGELAAIALQNSRNRDEIVRSNRRNEEIINELNRALAEVKTLTGLLPICSICKKIRDDKGYWKQIEQYISDHSDAEFSHSICQECAAKYYPEMDLYDDAPSS